jgi:hypothetical protein
MPSTTTGRCTLELPDPSKLLSTAHIVRLTTPTALFSTPANTDSINPFPPATDNMASITTPGQPFRFMDLPGELRKKVHKILLCSFEAPPRSVGHQDYHNYSPLFTTVPAKHSVDTTILRVNNQVHHEALRCHSKDESFHPRWLHGWLAPRGYLHNATRPGRCD